jgi:hypothetical protein
MPILHLITVLSFTIYMALISALSVCVFYLLSEMTLRTVHHYSVLYLRG